MTVKEYEKKCIELVERLHKRYVEKKDFICFCECYDSTICQMDDDTVEVWVNDDALKFNHNNGINYTMIPYKVCPICGKGNTSGFGPEVNKTNGTRVI